jgi:hypothetical protein
VVYEEGGEGDEWVREIVNIDFYLKNSGKNQNYFIIVN